MQGVRDEADRDFQAQARSVPASIGQSAPPEPAFLLFRPESGPGPISSARACSSLRFLISGPSPQKNIKTYFFFYPRPRQTLVFFINNKACCASIRNVETGFHLHFLESVLLFLRQLLRLGRDPVYSLRWMQECLMNLAKRLILGN